MRARLLDLQSCSLRFGGLAALSDVSLAIDERELTGLIGPNGAGKSSLFNVVTGVYRPTSGHVALRGRSIVGRRPSHIARLGIVRTFQNIRLFESLSVEENIRVAFNSRLRHGMLHAVTRGAAFRREEEEIGTAALELLDLFELRSKSETRVSELSYGDRRRVEIVRALAVQPKLLMLDEPAAGMNSSEKEDLMALIRRIHTELNLTILLVEHDMRVVMGTCSRIVVMDQGRILADGPPEEVRADERVITAYLGRAK